MVEELAGPEDVAAFGDEAHFEAIGAEGHGLHGDGFQFTRVYVDDVVGHKVGVGEDEFDLSACLHREFGLGCIEQEGNREVVQG